jgi:hypothetical protein
MACVTIESSSGSSTLRAAPERSNRGEAGSARVWAGDVIEIGFAPD